MGILLNQTEIAKAFDTTPQNILKWQKEGFPQKAKQGRYCVYDTGECIRWYAARGQAKIDDYQRNRSELTYHQAKKAELEARKMRGELIDLILAERILAEVVGAVRAKLIAIPTRLAQVALAATSLTEVEEAVRYEIYQALDEFPESILESVEEDGGIVASAADSDGEPVGGAESDSESGEFGGTGEVEKQ